MNIPITPTAHALTDFVFRSADRMRIDGCANAVAREGLSLALFCEHEALLDHYLGLLLTQLRQQAPEHSIEVYFPTNTDSLLARFNEALARQSVEQATRSPTSAGRAQIWIVHDAQALPESEIQLLARLIQNFPGANIRAILLMSGINGSNSSLSAFGRKILRWDIEAPTPEQAQAALDAAQAEGRLLPVQQLLKRIQRPSWNDDETVLALATPSPTETTALTPPPQATPSSPLAQKILTFHQTGQQALHQSARVLGRLRQLPHWRGSHTWMALGVVVALVCSTLIMLWLQPQAFGIHLLNQPVPKAERFAPLPAVKDIAPDKPSSPEGLKAPASSTDTATPRPNTR